MHTRKFSFPKFASQIISVCVHVKYFSSKSFLVRAAAIYHFRNKNSTRNELLKEKHRAKDPTKA